MSDPLSVFVSWAGAGAGGGAGFLAIKWFVEWVAGRVDKRQDVIDKGTQQLIKNLQDEVGKLIKRVDGLEKELEECRTHRAEDHAKYVELKAFLQGSGDAKQQAQLYLAHERLVEKGVLDE